MIMFAVIIAVWISVLIMSAPEISHVGYTPQNVLFGVAVTFTYAYFLNLITDTPKIKHFLRSMNDRSES